MEHAPGHAAARPAPPWPGAALWRWALLAAALLLARPALAGAGAPLFATLFEEPLVATRATTADEDASLAQALRGWQAQADGESLQGLAGYVSQHPESGWNAALLANLGLLHYHAGRFSQAIAAWEAAWRAGKGAADPKAKALVDRALGELMRMHARIGHADRLEALLAEMGGRAIAGPATETVAGAKEGLWMMRHEPGVSYLCGPMALKSLLLAQGAGPSKVKFLDGYRSGPAGVSLAEVGRLARQAKLPHRLVRREPGQALPVPSVIHWKVGHYAAVTGESAGRYHIQDPTFGHDLWVSRAALDEEASGFFLVPGRRLGQGWRVATAAEAGEVHGMGYTGATDPSRTRPKDPKAKPPSCPLGMCQYNISEMLVSLSLGDTPVGYAPPVGPAVYTTLTYNQREAGQPANFGFFNIGPKWSLNWLSFIQEDQALVAGGRVRHVVAGGGYTDEAGFNSATGQFTAETLDGTVLARTAADPVRYERRLPDGGVEVYAHSGGVATYPRRVFLSQIIDPQGNALALDYDGQFRLASITDASGRETTFSYANPGFPLQITAVTDPFGRKATLDYDAGGRLVKITDAIGLASQFHYDAARPSFIDQLATGYGTTRFAYGESLKQTDNPNDKTNGDLLWRWLEITDPLGGKERVEYRLDASGLGIGNEQPAAVPAAASLRTRNEYLKYRNTFYWDKAAYAQLALRQDPQNPAAPIFDDTRADNYAKARLRHWTHSAVLPGTAGGPLESEKQPLENRVWYNYPGQPGHGDGPLYAGTLDLPTRIARVNDSGQTELAQFEYNAQGNVTRRIDPVGRETRYEYAANGIDLLRVRQKTAASAYATLAEYAYDSRHLPLTHKDAAGQTTTYEYNSAGQVTKATDALGNATSYFYDTYGDSNLGNLHRITNANNQSYGFFHYDTFGRVSSVTDAGNRLFFLEYDALDRVTRATYPDRTTYEYTWDKLDVVAVKDRDGKVTRYTYDANRDLTAATDPQGHTVRYGYYKNGALKTLADGNGNVTAWDRDLQGRATAKRHADGTFQTYAYDAAGRLQSATDALNQTKAYTYAPDGRLAGINYANPADRANPTPNVAFTDDPWFPRRARMDDGTGATLYAYHAPGQPGALRLAREDGPYLDDAVTYQYDALGRVTSRAVGGDAETYAYDAIGRVASHASALGRFDYAYDWAGRRPYSRQLAPPPGKYGAFITYWGIAQSEDRPSGVIHRLINAPARSYAYKYPARGLRLAEASETAPVGALLPSEVWRYGYDPSGRLASAQAQTDGFYGYAHDDADNLAEISAPDGGATRFTANTLNQAATADGRPWVYDDAGNLLDDGVRAYRWDAENRLVKAVRKASPADATTLRYDGLGRWRASASGGGAADMLYVWCGEDLCQARDAAGVRRGYFAEGEARNGGAGARRRYYARDRLGSVRDVVDIGAWPPSAVTAALDYGPYGQTVRSAGADLPDFRYAGMFYLPRAGLYLARHRAYDPAAGRWLSRDPIGEAGGVNLYGYVGGDPVNWVDPLGLDPLCATDGSQRITCVDGMRPPPLGTPINGPLSPTGILAPIVDLASSFCPPLRAEQSALRGLADARAARDTLAGALAPLKGKAPATVTGGYNTQTGQIAAKACSGGKCAEDHVFDALGGNKESVHFTEAIRPRTGEEVPVCPRCEGSYGREAFPPGTKFKTDQ